MLDLLFRKMGYVPAASASLVDDSPAPAAPSPPPHRRDEASFDFSVARHDDLCFYYDDGDDTYSYAVGRPDWAPLAIAGLKLPQTDKCDRMVLESVASRLWIAQGACVLESWREANAGVFDTLRKSVDGFGLPDTSTIHASDPERKNVTLLGTAEMASLFDVCWQRARIESPVFFLANSRAYITLATHHAMRGASDSAEHALERALDWLAVWFESRGMGIDRARRLVNIPGYEPLFHRTSQGI
ncbi:hypothetical protein [Paraburkholderia sp. BL10I2N1]|uniref:hypothetical protein n=1 Tax=Paraburkholderia sp. BL10I2N1 TaxID=1938796 RepID=UPI00105D33D4|nr:hypothetical protein [Paraburkholderia sp. BL10I2N1]TDN59018.1 hypothetical protein B0G77_8203 [Paraburkholderia sp. BL10I2N1]